MQSKVSPDRLASLAYFSRGRGRQHAIEDCGIVSRLSLVAPDCSLVLLSYATGYQQLAASALPATVHSLIDLSLPEDPFASPWHRIEAMRREAELLRSLQPRLVVSHEEFTALAAAKVFGLPTVFVTDWFVDDDQIASAMLKYADHILVADHPNVYPEPKTARGKVTYFGCRTSGFRSTREDRARARRELGVADDCFVLAVFVAPGRRTEAVAPTFDLVAATFALLPRASKRLFWLASDDYEDLAVRAVPYPDLTILPEGAKGPDLMAAADFALTKGNRNIVQELSARGLPTISLTHGLNTIDDFRTKKIRTNRTLVAETTDTSVLLRHLEEMTLASPPADHFGERTDVDGEIAQAIMSFLDGP